MRSSFGSVNKNQNYWRRTLNDRLSVELDSRWILRASNFSDWANKTFQLTYIQSVRICGVIMGNSNARVLINCQIPQCKHRPVFYPRDVYVPWFYDCADKRQGFSWVLGLRGGNVRNRSVLSSTWLASWINYWIFSFLALLTSYLIGNSVTIWLCYMYMYLYFHFVIRILLLLHFVKAQLGRILHQI